MLIYYIKKSEILKKIDIHQLNLYDDGRAYKSEKKRIEHLLGLYLIKNVLKKYFIFEDVEIEIINKKPVIKNSNLHFNLSHSNDIIMLAISESNIGLDIEFMKEKNYKKILERINRPLKSPTISDFYKIWTRYEAEIKLGEPPKFIDSIIFNSNYMVSVASVKKISELNFEEFNI